MKNQSWSDVCGDTLQLVPQPDRGRVILRVEARDFFLTPEVRCELAAALLDGLDETPSGDKRAAFVDVYNEFITTCGAERTLNTDDLRGIWEGLRAAGVVK